ncbi:MAG: aspartate kinase [Oligoflexia bacterium]|nr:aspartate kinase [Oligoflexia bacterium]
MALLVQKFGGTSVGTPERIRAVADRIARTRAEGFDLVVVVSAMGHTTDELIELAHRVSDQPPRREMDMLLTAGERISMALLSMALADRGVAAISLTGSQTGIITDESHRRARIRRILGDRVRAAVSEGKVVIVAGFQGVSEKKEITTLGRGGSDTTAVALAAALKAESCDIFTDVDGVYSADPRVVPSARLWREIPQDLMVELATRGAGVLHSRSVELARQYGVRLRVLNSLDTGEGTVVTADNQDSRGMEEYRIAGVTCDRGRVLLRIELERPTVMAAVWDRAAQAHLSVASPIFSGTMMQFFIERDAENEWKKHLEELVFLGFLKSYAIEKDLLPVSVVGDRFSQDGAALNEIVETLAQSHISVTMGSASALAITVAVPATHAEDAVKALHARYFA